MRGNERRHCDVSPCCRRAPGVGIDVRFRGVPFGPSLFFMVAQRGIPARLWPLRGQRSQRAIIGVGPTVPAVTGDCSPQKDQKLPDSRQQTEGPE